MQVVCFFGGDKPRTSIALCGREIPKIKPRNYSYHSDTTKITQRLDKINCVTCLRLRVKQLNGLIEKTIDKIDELIDNGKGVESEQAIRQDEQIL